MTKSNEYVGVDEKYIPEGEQEKTHVQEPIIGSDNAQKIRDGITGGVDKLTSDEGKERVKAGVKKGWKIFKGIGIGYLVFFCIVAILTITIIVVAIVNVIKIQSAQDNFMDDFENTSNSMIEKYNADKKNLNLHNGINWRVNVSDDLEEIYTNNKSGEHLITVVNGGTSTTDPQQIHAIANSIEGESISKKYDITIEYGDDGYVETYTFEEF